jgi:predicted short-subunit dehydrogenase-like oxidoreductase (DUF2520 family)
VFVFGAGKVGRALARALRRAGVAVTLRASRAGLPQKTHATLVILAVSDRELPAVAYRMAGSGVVGDEAAVVHVAGALGPEVLAPLRGMCAGVGQMHPLASFASLTKTPRLAGTAVHIQGDRIAVARARQVARRIGMKPWTQPDLHTARYHAAAGLVANGTAALAAVATELLAAAGVARGRAPGMLGPLIRTVADNVEALGLPDALTGPVRRGDVRTVERHIQAVLSTVPDALELYAASARAQLVLARAIKDAPRSHLEEIARLLADPFRSRT